MDVAAIALSHEQLQALVADRLIATSISKATDLRGRSRLVDQTSDDDVGGIVVAGYPLDFVDHQRKSLTFYFVGPEVCGYGDAPPPPLGFDETGGQFQLWFPKEELIRLGDWEVSGLSRPRIKGCSGAGVWHISRADSGDVRLVLWAIFLGRYVQASQEPPGFFGRATDIRELATLLGGDASGPPPG